MRKGFSWDCTATYALLEDEADHGDHPLTGSMALCCTVPVRIGVEPEKLKYLETPTVV